jgi:hypothetical protein
MKKRTTIKPDDDDCYDDDPEEFQESGRKQGGPVEQQKLSSNPIVAAVQHSLNPGNPFLVLKAEYPDKSLARLFSDPALLRQELGGMLLNALTSGDKNFIKMVRRALIEIDRVFHRHRQKELLDSALAYIVQIDDKHLPAEEIKKGIEMHCIKNGKTLHAHQWRDLRVAFGLQRLPKKAGPGRGNRKTASK